MSSSEFNDKSVIVTGGASGIGQGIVEAFADAGAYVFIADIDVEKGERLVKELGSRVQFISTDVTDEQQIENCVRTVCDTAGRVDCLINNAGIEDNTAKVEDISAERARKLFDVILFPTLIATKHVTPRMREAGGGVIINTASVTGVVPFSGTMIYGALKAAMIHWTRAVATQLATDDIRMNCISPGGIPTPLVLRQVFPDGGEEALSQLSQVMADAQPIKRVGEAKDIAEAALFLASSKASWITGHNLVVDGGYTTLTADGQ